MSSNEEIGIRENQLEEDLQRVQTLIQSLAKSSSRDNDIADIKDIFSQLDTELSALDVEIQTLGVGERKKYTARYKDYKQRIQEAQQDFKFRQSNSTKDELLGDHTEDTKVNVTADSLMAKGRDEMMKTEEAGDRIIQTIQATHEVAVETAETLHKQQHQLEVFADNLDEIGTTLSRANDIVRRMARKVLCDKYIWALIFLIVVAIIAILIYKQSTK